MQPRNRPSWIRIVILGVSLIIALTAVQLGLAQGPGDPSAAADGGETDLFGVRILDPDMDLLAELGIALLPPDEQGDIFADVTAEELERMRSAGVVLEELGRVGVLADVDSPGLLAYIEGTRETDKVLDCDGQWDPIPIPISGAYPGAVVTAVYYRIWYDTDTPSHGCSCFDQLDLEIYSATDTVTLHSYDSNCCAPISPPPGEEKPASTVQCYTSGWVSHAFDGNPVNQTWRIRAINRCYPSGCASHTFDKWIIKIYYLDPTPTPTASRTPTRTPTRTNTPTITPSPTPQCTPGYLRIHKWEDLDRDGVMDDDEPPVSHLSFTVSEVGGHRVTSCTTNSEGKCNLTDLCPGEYDVVEPEVNCWGYSTPRTRRVYVAEDTWTHVYFGNYRLEPGLEVDKTLIRPSSGTATVGDTVRFRVEFTNTGDTAITSLDISDDYDPACLEFQYSSIPRTTLDTTLGHISYVHVLDHFGGRLAPGESISVTLTFLAWGYCQPTENCVTVDSATDECCNVTRGLSDCADVFIDPAPCSEAIANGDFETGDLTGWAWHASEILLRPFTTHWRPTVVATRSSSGPAAPLPRDRISPPATRPSCRSSTYRRTSTTLPSPSGIRCILRTGKASRTSIGSP